jgi:hypothetical protein
MEYKVLKSWHKPGFDPGDLEKTLNEHAADGWRVVSTFQAVSWWSWRVPVVVVLQRSSA